MTKLAATTKAANRGAKHQDGAICWHYTVGARLGAILASQVLRPAEHGVPQGERPVVWFSSNPDWEQTANKGMIDNGAHRSLTKDETEEFAKGLFRIGVSLKTAPHNWREYQRLSGAQQKMLRGLVASAISIGANPNDWRVSFERVPSSQWLTVEKWNGSAWVEVEPSNAI